MVSRKKCIAMVPCPGLSHLIPLVEFAKRLVLEHNELHVTFLIPTLGPLTPSMKSILNSLPPNIDFTLLPQVNIEDLPKNIHLTAQMNLTVKLSLPFLHEALTSLSSRTQLVALVADVFSNDTIDVAKHFNLLSYIFSTSGALLVSLGLFLPNYDESVSSESLDLTKSVNLPGCTIPFKGKDLPEPLHFTRSSETYKSFLLMCQRLYVIDGIIVNTFTDLEADAIRAVREIKESNNSPYIYPVGPIIQTESRSMENNESDQCIGWLNNQPPNSVLYISFGSGGTISDDQISELAFGLEMSGHRFLWVLRAPNQFSSSAYFTGQKDNPLDFLPSGFLNRIKGQGLVVPSWAPQIEVLRHGSTGAFMTHCGWSSVLESVAHGVPMIAWPLFGEQKMNAVTLTEVLKVAMRPKADETGIVKRDEIGKVIKKIMEGDESLQIRRRIEGFSAAASNAVNENGSSKRALASLAMKWQSGRE